MSIQLGSTKWTSNTPHPFSRAPGAGLGSTKWTSNTPHPFARAPGGGMGLASSGFEAQEQSIDMDEERIESLGPFTVERQEIKPGDIPSMVIKFRYTDRGTLTKAKLDAKVKTFLAQSGYRTSKASSFQPANVTWKWGTIGVEASGDVPLYVPVVATPSPYAGIRYSGNKFGAPMYTPDMNVLAPLPNQIWIYTVVITSSADTMTDGESAQALTLLKQAMVNMAPALAYSTVLITLRGCPLGVFKTKLASTPLAKAGWSSLILYVAYQMVIMPLSAESVG